MQVHQRTGKVFEYFLNLDLIEFPLLEYALKGEGEVLKHEVSFAVLDEVVEVVHDVSVLHSLVEFILSLLLLVILTHLNVHKFLGKDVSSLEYFSR